MIPKIDVVILTWNDEPGQLDAAVASALASASVDVRVIVVDNGSDEPAAVAEDERMVLVRNAANRGVAAGRNQGAALGVRSLVCFLDSDARLEPDCLGALAGAVGDDATTAMAAPVFTGQVPEASAGRAPSIGRKVARGFGWTASYRPVPRRSIQSEWDVDFAIGACQLWHRSTFVTMGGFDERFFYGPEDIDACRRIQRCGGRVVQVAQAHCEHPPRRRHRRLFTGPGLRHGLALLRYFLRPLQPSS